ncbi:ribosome biogenesis GTP-binding protein YihA/YsxC [Bulleidia sp. zg-1006]|uniref:ribosome biogenesis GTP-binding protein YihA/YsxC n=1 Tax=Bulleidia sp. zg-1006 TaxID=2806552 RepID=UPI0019397B79|nr:ribosome biogenesis GTP-binding protein YihA/YsxC [Bulleidia sp. zg-1006]QRG87406.1 YihA family ribosome biogenesis GTP-binding protein [Bulleidia sp. zg-1006]
MQYFEAKWLASAAHQDQWPEHDLPEIVFVGRSNAGKSSLINALVNRNRLAYTGKTPGKTRLLNFFVVNNQFVFTDAPGYGYAVGSRHSLIEFGILMEPYFAKRENLKAVVLVLDARRKPSEEDISMVEYAKTNHLAILAVCTKKDKLSYGQLKNQQFAIAKELKLNANSFLAVDSLKKQGMDEVWDKINETLSLK